MADPLVFPLTHLPFDITELILGRIESRRDLVSFAATSTACKELVIPRHTEYRTLRLSGHPEVWAHLAERPDLARNIRDVTISEAARRTSAEPQRYPTTLTLVDTASRLDTADVVIANICKALRSMEFLRSFTWVDTWTPSGAYIDIPHYYNDIFQVLKNSKSLVRFKVVDDIVQRAVSVPEETEEYPLWHIADLQTLSLRQLGWWPRGLDMLLARSPNLQNLDIRLPLDPSLLAPCHFPQLRRVNLNFNPTGSASEQVVLEFLQRHPTVEDLRWYPRHDTLSLSHGSLPNLKRLITTPPLACSILSDPTVPNRAIVCVSQVSLDESTLAILDAIDTSQLRDLRVWRYSGLEAVNDLAQRLPHLTHLEIPQFGIPTRNDTANDYTYTIDDYVLTLSKFRSLEYLIDSSIWPALQLGGEEKIASLAVLCPSLQRLGYFNTQKSEYVDIVLHRDSAKFSWTQEKRKREWHD
ncbi:hypothetical protein C8F04DRAFT_1029103 [Mycena alexandri]|uniref:F-box domain-containing protein n=1 Tax=Mycena alexandri TaxID=1745969 RepID=A0AAD6TCE5_9AGAR|nr:hypothetical protein C8F04DRAFT_1029103 [Mycena alexandri]